MRLRPAFVDKREHGLAHRLRAAHRLIGGEAANGTCDERHGGVGVHSPMGDEQRAALRIDKGACKAGKRLGALHASGRRVARRKDHPIGVELQAGDLRGGEISIIFLARALGWRQQQAWLGAALELPGERAMRCEMHDPIVGQFACWLRRLTCFSVARAPR